MKYLLPLLMLSALTSRSQAQVSERWMQYSKGRESTEYVDTTSMQVIGEMRTIWARSIYNQPQPVRGDSSKFYTERLIQLTVKCESRTYTFRNVITRNNSEVVTSYKYELPLQWQEVVPETFGELTFNTVCKLPVKKQ